MMRVVCIRNSNHWDSVIEGPDLEVGKIYIVVDEGWGYGWSAPWNPFSKYWCYSLAGFPTDILYWAKCFVKIVENPEEELALYKGTLEHTRLNLE